MKLKINWGGGIVITIVVMVTFMLVLVFIATRQDYYLVDKDYYQKAVNYQEQIDKINNANSLDEKVNIQYNNKLLKLQFPNFFQNDSLAGTINLYSPVNEKYDLNLSLKIDTSLSQFVSLAKLPKGRYKVKLDWTANEKPFYQEIEIMHK
jgi:hypothetical protein